MMKALKESLYCLALGSNLEMLFSLHTVVVTCIAGFSTTRFHSNPLQTNCQHKSTAFQPNQFFAVLTLLNFHLPNCVIMAKLERNKKKGKRGGNKPLYTRPFCFSTAKQCFLCLIKSSCDHYDVQQASLRCLRQSASSRTSLVQITSELLTQNSNGTQHTKH